MKRSLLPALAAAGALAALVIAGVDVVRTGQGDVPATPRPSALAIDTNKIVVPSASLQFSPATGAAVPLDARRLSSGHDVPPAIVPFVRPASTIVERASDEARVAPPTVAPGVIGQFDFRIAPSFREQLDAVMTQRGRARMQFPVTAGRSVDLAIVRHDEQETGGVVFGRVSGHPMADAVLAYVGDAVAGSIVTPEGELFEVRYVGGGVHRVLHLDPNQIPNEGEVVAPAAQLASAALAHAHGHSHAQPNAMTDEDDSIQVWDPAATPVADAPAMAGDAADVYVRDGSNTVIDMVIVYTPNSRANNGGASGMLAVINAAVAKANLAFANSQAGIVLRVAHAAEVSYNSGGSLGTDLGRLQNASDGYMDDVYTLRQTYNADLVSLFVPAGNDGTAGIAYLLNFPQSGIGAYNWAFSVVVDIYADGNITFAHEVGHNLGASHAAADGGSGIYSYAYGYKFTANNTAYRTVMAYAPGIRIPYFSNPNLTYLGVPLGTANANNALTLRNSRTNAASSKHGVADWTVSAQGDMNADGKPDLVWRNMLNGRSIAWMMDNATRTSTATLWPATNAGDSAWVPMIDVDLNADNKVDMVWRNTSTGRVIAWIMDGVTRTSTATLWAPTTATDMAWMPMTAGDFNADNKPDLVWRNTITGRVIVWYMDGVTRTGTATLWSPTTTADMAWVPFVAMDFNADAKPDLVFRNETSGRVIIWYMDGATRTSTFALWPATNAGEAAWRPMAVGDFNADGQIDMVWRNTDSGRVIIWYMNGTTRVGTAVIWS